MKYLDYIIEDVINQSKNDLNDNFWKWFGNSKIVDKNGNPLVCYHGTNKKFNSFNKSIKGSFGEGIYFTPNYNTAKQYGSIKQVYLKIENPLYLNSNTSKELWDAVLLSNKKILKDYDGIIVGSINYISEIIVFEPNQIKSINNNGEWNLNSNNIYESLQKIKPNIEKYNVKHKFNETIAYHGSTSLNIKYFVLDKIKRIDYGYGFYFTSSKKLAQKYATKNGIIYKCEIPDDKFMIVNYKAVNKQSIYIMNAFVKLINNIQPTTLTELKERGTSSAEDLINLIQSRLNMNFGGKEFSNLLYSLGIKGIIYKDPQYNIINYVIFNKNDIKILDKDIINEDKIQDKYKDQVQIDGVWYHKRIIDNHFGEGFFNKIKIGDEIDWGNKNDNEENKNKHLINGNQLFSIAKNYFGLTNSIYNAGYILPDGSLLKFGENQKDYEHIEVEAAFQEYDIDASMYDFINVGAIRIIPSSNSITLLISAEPTYQQRKIIINLLNQGFKVNIEYAKDAKDYLFGNKENLQYRSYDLNNLKKLEQDINSFFNNGKLSNEFFESFIIYKK